MQIIFSEEFRKDFRRIKDKTTRLRIIASLRKLEGSPTAGKPLRYDLKAYRSLRVPPFRIIYRIERNALIVCAFAHRSRVYRQAEKIR